MLTKVIYLNKNTEKNVILWNIIIIENNFSLFQYILKSNYSWYAKAQFSAATIPVFRVTWSFRNHSDMQIWCYLIYLWKLIQKM